jgi:hypothetical protein
LSARSDASSLEALLADEFVEFGRSGRCSAVGATAMRSTENNAHRLCKLDYRAGYGAALCRPTARPALPLPREREALRDDP